MLILTVPLFTAMSEMPSKSVVYTSIAILSGLQALIASMTSGSDRAKADPSAGSEKLLIMKDLSKIIEA
jgi:hypothetical protein